MPQLWPVTIGDGAIIAANATVVKKKCIYTIGKSSENH
jgi:acetyltransferase-like isoleucine patch superfamily enzyme